MATASNPSLDEYFDAAFQASFDGTNASDLKPLQDASGQPLLMTIAKDGFSAQAFKTPDGQVIVAYAGTDFKALVSGTDAEKVLAVDQIADDVSIYLGYNPPAFQDGLAFLQMAESAATLAGLSIAPGNVFVDGHSLGGAIAAYVAAQDGLPGTTFAAPGLAPGDIPAGADSGAVTAYAEYGDPIGNYGDEPNVEGRFLHNQGITRFGTTTTIGASASTDSALLAIEMQELKTAASVYARNKAEGTALFAADAVANHALTNYATDLGIPTPPHKASDLGITVQQLVAAIDQAVASGTVAGLAVSFGPHASFADPGSAMLTGTASSPDGVRSVEITAQVDGASTDLGAATLNADGTFSFADPVGSQAQSDITATATDGIGNTASRTASFLLQNGHETALYGATEGQNGGLTAAPPPRGGSNVVDISAPGQIAVSDAYDVFENGGQRDTTFVFSPGFGIDVIAGFGATGPDHDLIALPSSDFRSLAAVFRDTGDVNGSAFITDPVTGDAIRLAGVTTAELKANPRDVALVG